MKEPDLEGIAIIGMTGRFPGARNVDEFWRNLTAGVESISTFSDEELEASGLDVAALKNDRGCVAARGVLEDTELFDATFFDINAKEAEVTDPQQRLFLEASWEVLEDAGYHPDGVDGLIGVYAGGGGLTYYLNNLQTRPDVIDLVGERLISLGNDKDYLATRIAYKLNLRGPALSINTACSTGLVVVCQACQGLLNYQCDLAIAGGVSIAFPQRNIVRFQENGVFSSDGHCRPFDAQAQGTVSSDGLGVVLLKRLADAVKDGDQIYAVIKGFGLNNDGSDKVGFTAPGVDGQAEAIATAQAQSGFDPATISYVEAHGTATPIGDPIEIAALTQAFRIGTDAKNFCAIGSVKSNIGHLNAAAGIAGLIKTVLALKHKKLPPSLNFTQPNPKIDFASTPFFVNSKLTEWKQGLTPRRAGVSSFGLGGTNAHVVLEEAPATESPSPSREWQLLLLSAKTTPALDAATANFLAHLKANPNLNLADAASTLQTGRSAFDHRRMLVCRDIGDAIQALEIRDPKRIITRDADAGMPSVVFMFPGQGAQYVNMGADLYRSEAVFKEEIDRCSEILLPLLGTDLRHALYPAGGQEKAAEELLTQTRITQPALFTIEYALATLWMSWGIKPSALIGHSVGEYVAACLSGVFTLEDALALVARRGALMQGMPPGSMLAVPMPEAELKKIIPPALSLATVNGPSQCVVSGPTPEIDAFLAALGASGKIGTVLHTSHAFHSGMMDPILQTFTECVGRVKREEPKIPFLSNLTGTWISAPDACNPQYWAKHLRNAVRFGDGIKELLKNPNSVLLEVGPGTTLSSLAKLQQGQPNGRLIISSLRHVRETRPDLSCLLAALGQLWMHGVKVDWPGFYAHEQRRRISLPTYPFQRERYWIERRKPAPATALPQGATQRSHDPADWFYLPAWKRSELPITALDNNPPAQKLQWLVFLDEGGLGGKLAEHLSSQQQSVTRVLIGEAYQKIDEETYTINPELPGDYKSLISDLCTLGRVPRKIVHLWSLSNSQRNAKGWAGLDRVQSLGLHSLLFLSRALGGNNVSAKLDMEIVLNNVHAVTGEETLHPEKATALGACKVIPLEYSNINCRSIDIILPEPGTAGEQKLLKQLLNEFSTKPSEPVVAYRGAYRWIEIFEHVRLEPPAGVASRLKPKGVYLITGGLGGIGLTLAESLAKSVQAKLILTGRSALPDKEQWAGWLSAHDDQDETSYRIRKIQLLESAGAEVLVVAADVADLDRMREVITLAKSRFGQINGVIHAAGSVDFAGVIHRRTKEDTDEILAAKVKGTLVLNELFTNTGLDFLVLCSSIGNVVSGLEFGQVGYAAANEFLDSYAFYKKASDDIYTVAINWDAWRDVGMAAEARKKHAKVGKNLRILTSGNSLTAPEGAEVFNRIMNYSFTRVVVSVADLNDSRRNFTGLQQQPVAEEAGDARAIKHARPEVGIAFTAPTNEPERVLANIWQELLGIEKVGIHDNFFDLGGDSLLLLRVQVKISKALGVDLSSAEMFEHSTIDTLARRVSQPAAQPDGLDAIQNRAHLQRAASGRQRRVMKQI